MTPALRQFVGWHTRKDGRGISHSYEGRPESSVSQLGAVCSIYRTRGTCHVRCDRVGPSTGSGTKIAYHLLVNLEPDAINPIQRPPFL